MREPALQVIKINHNFWDVSNFSPQKRLATLKRTM